MIEARLIDFVVVKGKLEPVRIYELIGERGDISPRQKQSLILFSRAIDAYLSSDFNRALELLNELHEREPKDAVASLYLERCRQYLVTPPEADWRGVFRHTTK
jgi:adenylate cyclase